MAPNNLLLIERTVFASIILLAANGCSGDLGFRKIPPETRVWNNAISEAFVVSNYIDTRKNEAQIDRFVCDYLDSMRTDYIGISLSFFRRSEKTSVEKLTKSPDRISESYEDDYLWTYYKNADDPIRKVKLKNFKNREFFYPSITCEN